MPTLPGFLPKDGLIPNSERYVVGPVSLDRVAHDIPPSAAGFRYGAEAQSGKYRTSKGEVTMLIFSYPTPTMARERFDEFQKLPGVFAKRSQSLVAVIPDSPDPDTAERLLAKFRYEGNVTLNEKVPQDFNKAVAITALAVGKICAALEFLEINKPALDIHTVQLDRHALAHIQPFETALQFSFHRGLDGAHPRALV